MGNKKNRSSRILNRIKQQRQISALSLNLHLSNGFQNNFVKNTKLNDTPVKWRTNFIAGDNENLIDQFIYKSPTHLEQSLTQSLPNQKCSNAKKSHSTVKQVNELHKTPSIKLFNSKLLFSTTSNSISLQAKLQEARQALKKSQENLSALCPLNTPLMSKNCLITRSKSIGNLKLSTAIVSSNTITDSINSPKLNQSFVLSAKKENKLNNQKRKMALSENNLIHKNESNDDYETNASLKTQYAVKLNSENKVFNSVNLLTNIANGTSSRMAQSIRDLQKNSEADLTDKNLFEEKNDYNDCEINELNQYYSTLPKNFRRGVQKKLERNSGIVFRFRNRASYCSNLTSQQQVANTILSVPEVEVSDNKVPAYVNSINRTVSSMEPRINRLDLVNNGLNLATTRRTPNYLAQKFNGTNYGALDSIIINDNIELPIVTPKTKKNLSDFLTAVNLDSLTSQTAKKMAMHTSDCIEEMTKACDKLLNARHLICCDMSIDSNEKETLVLNVDKAINLFCFKLHTSFSKTVLTNNTQKLKEIKIS